MIAVGSWAAPQDAAELIMAGVVRALPKPVSPDTLVHAVHEVRSQSTAFDMPEPLGELTIEQLADQLASQVRDGLLGAAKPESRNVPVALGQGTEVVAAVWSALARIRETLTVQSSGALRFERSGPVGAVPLAPWVEPASLEARSRRGMSRDEPAQEPKLRLDGRRVLVADDDPAVTWFLSGLFRSAGAVVVDAHDGFKALELAYRYAPEIAISDILMPGLDGFALCRHLKRDVALRDTPVVLLSWKEDLLQRVRELGANADGYMKKESSGPAILRTAHELLRPRLRVESRLKAGGEVRGRLDGLTARALIMLTAANMPDASIVLRDASFLYELELRDGLPRSATRTAHDGSFRRGVPVLQSLLGLFSGRFQVMPASSPVKDILRGDLPSLLNPSIAKARAAARLLTGASLLNVAHVQIDRDALILEATPEPARSHFLALAEGIPPHALVRSSGLSPEYLEDILRDAASRGAVSGVLDANGVDLMAPLVEEQLELLRTDLTAPPRSLSRPPPEIREACRGECSGDRTA